MSKRRWGDRRDATLVRKMDGMHFIMPLIYPNRCDNEAFISERIDLTAIGEYLDKKNSQNPEYRYNVFQIIVAAVLKTVMHRPLMNRFVMNGNTYQRNELSASFVIKKVFEDGSEEGLARVKCLESYTIEDIHNSMYKKISACRTEKKKGSTEDALDIFNKLPRFISKAAVRFVCMLDRHGMVPPSLVSSDPYYSSVILTNLGSIKLHSGYHHLTNWGTTSVFVIVGEKKLRPYYDEFGNVTMKDSIDLGLTVDERIADGYYFSKTIRLLKKLLEEPELLEKPFGEEVEY